ncbi:MAG: putative lipid II flippase FtsW, partial [Gammaproteobacteria bacterium]
SMMYLASKLPLDVIERVGHWLLFFSIALLILVLVPGIGRVVNGSARWLNLGLFQFQVSEMVKLCVILYLAGYLVRRGDEVREKVSGFIKPMGLMAFIALLLLLEPDFGATAVVLATALAMMFLAGVKLWHYLILMLASGGAMALLAVAEPYRVKRITSFLDPWADPFNTGFQLTQALIAIGRGEWFGVGIGDSVQKLFYLPEAHTDFLYAVMVEETGLMGGLLLILLYGTLLHRCFKVGDSAQRKGMEFGAYTAYGVGIWLGMQAAVNLGVNLGVLPTKGLTLPLMSYGGSSLLITCAALGLVLNIDMQTRRTPAPVVEGEIAPNPFKWKGAAS